MPIAEILIFEGRSDDQKRAIMREFPTPAARITEPKPDRS